MWPSAAECLKEFDEDGDGLLNGPELGRCLEAVLHRHGRLSAEEARRRARLQLEEWSLRSEHSAGEGALDRLLRAVRPKSRSRSPQANRSQATAESLASAAEKERQLQREAASWQAPSSLQRIPLADAEEIPTVDLADPTAQVAQALRAACERVGFFYLQSHGVDPETLALGEQAVRDFCALEPEVKAKYLMDRPESGYPGGTGYLPLHNRKLPKRAKGNVVEAFIVKRELGPRNITLDQMPWPQELPAWRQQVEAYGSAMEQLALKLLGPLSLALGQAEDFLAPAFRSPLWRLRQSSYPPVPPGGYEEEQYGIAPHVDTSFFTLLHRVESEASLVVWAFSSQRWVRVPNRPGLLLVNAGEILRQTSNDTFQSARHYVLNSSAQQRYSLAFFFNATADYEMAVAPGFGEPKYPPASYLQSQGVVQGE
ncbi:unnamed protein product [Effrenium voratum]|uniref:Fe2OG dioxygenase domain-containing protein n=1 Tax=Effrenium voratum TaxID=2562239 RepID=A0AA36J271_9DINO|nr:unnamed protein product [Effrenium voratum]CAJ1397153.1 unnamed protein product [Effrenium voratum]CAJ1444549.1 unnamed protein product [Effrenium voratum]